MAEHSDQETKRSWHDCRRDDKHVDGLDRIGRCQKQCCHRATANEVESTTACAVAHDGLPSNGPGILYLNHSPMPACLVVEVFHHHYHRWRRRSLGRQPRRLSRLSLPMDQRPGILLLFQSFISIYVRKSSPLVPRGSRESVSGPKRDDGNEAAVPWPNNNQSSVGSSVKTASGESSL
jgi:hypothetical protein